MFACQGVLNTTPIISRVYFIPLLEEKPFYYSRRELLSAVRYEIDWFRVGSKRFARYRNLSRFISGRNFGPRLKTPSLSCRLLDNMECQINHSPAVNRFDRRKCNFHDKKLCVTCQSRQRNYRKVRKAANLHSTVHGFIFSGVLMTLFISADDKNVPLLRIQQRSWCFVFEQFENSVIDKIFRCLLKRDAWKIPEV